MPEETCVSSCDESASMHAYTYICTHAPPQTNPGTVPWGHQSTCTHRHTTAQVRTNDEGIRGVVEHGRRGAHGHAPRKRGVLDLHHAVLAAPHDATQKEAHHRGPRDREDGVERHLHRHVASARQTTARPRRVCGSDYGTASSRLRVRLRHRARASQWPGGSTINVYTHV